MAETSFSGRLLAWYDRYGRKDLPWQKNVTAYRVWVSEIMLQQTQVNAVIPYFMRFMRRFPNVRALADAPLEDVLECWSGLGYYARARHLHAAAGVIRDQFGGRVPQDLESLNGLPGIGRSTAGAILALAYQQRHPILDGNVKRVLARHRLIDGWLGKSSVQTRLWAAADTLTPKLAVAHYTQAMMDLGALVCVRRNPKCEACPVSEDCGAYRNNCIAEYPTQKPPKVRPARTTVMVMLQNLEHEVFLEQRPLHGRWGGLLSFPEVVDEAAAIGWCERRFSATPYAIDQWSTFRHTFSHFHLDITPMHLRIKCPTMNVMEAEGGVWYNIKRISGGVSAPVSKLLEQLINVGIRE